MLAGSERLASEHPGWPRFRAGLATGPAAVGHVGTAEQRSFAAIGDTTNLAARLQAQARPGEVVARRVDRRALCRVWRSSRWERVHVKGRREPVEVFGLGRRTLRPDHDHGGSMASVSLTWLGHSAFRFDTPAGNRIYVDPFLHGNPKCPEGELEPERIDLIALTHGHDDHVGDTVALASGSAARWSRWWSCAAGSRRRASARRRSTRRTRAAPSRSPASGSR